MNGEDRCAVVKAGQLIDARSVENVPSQGSGSGVRCDSARENHSDPPSRPCQLECAFYEKLVEVGVRAALDVIYARFTYEGRKPPSALATIQPRLSIAAVASHHVPGRVTHDGIESTIRQRIA
jgi:hypothetical protein